MPRILHLIGSQHVGGPEKQLLHHARDTRNAGYQVVLGSFQEDVDPPEILTVSRRHGVETVSIAGGIRPGLVDDLAQVLGRASVDLLCTHSYKANVVGHFAARQAGIPWVPFVRSFQAEAWQGTLYERLERSLLVRSPWVVCSSPTQARQLGRIRRGRPAPLVIPNAVLAPRETGTPQGPVPSRAELGITGRSFVFGAVGCLSRDKGHHDLLEAFARLRTMVLDQPLHLLLLGEGPEEAPLRRQARRLGIEPNVCFAGFQRKPAPWMKLMDCVVQPSLTEGASSSVLEAMLLGIPVIATDVGGMPELIENGRSGLLVVPESTVAMAEAMKKLVRSPGLRRQFSLEAKQRVERNFSPVRQRTLLEMLYQTLLGNAFSMQSEIRQHIVA